MKFNTKKVTIYIALLGIYVAILFAQNANKPIVTMNPHPSEPIATGDCKNSSVGYLYLNGKSTDFTDEEFGKMIMPALRQGYVITIYPQTKRGIFVYQECHNTDSK